MERAMDLLDVDGQTVVLILLAAVATYATRIGGYVLVTNLTAISPRLEAALNAVPAAVLATLVAPPLVQGGWDVRIAMLAALATAWRFPGLMVLVAGWAAAMIVRHGFGFGL